MRSTLFTISLLLAILFLPGSSLRSASCSAQQKADPHPASTASFISAELSNLPVWIAETDNDDTEDESEELFSYTTLPDFLSGSWSIEPNRTNRLSQKPYHLPLAHRLSLCCSLRI